ncbi:aubergine [Nesidiocoris tenuis]|uniref:Aubergine n=1 Tax=Nesidiocoris tenuis TaxID=355587 RepID=A0ABN7BCM8_9HEMI|nr:aubergine [Nesidiocoris tenuis]
MDQRRGRPAGGRARGSGAARGNPQQQQQQQQQQPQQRFETAPPPQQPVWGNRGQQNAPPQQQPQQQQQQQRPQQPPQQQQQQPPQQSAHPGPQGDVGALAAGVQKMNVGGDAPHEAAAGGVGRGGKRQRPLEDSYVYRRQDLGAKQGTSKKEPLMLKSNYFAFSNIANLTLYQYRVDFQPDEDRTAFRKGILRDHRSEFGSYIFDGTVLYTLRRLPENHELMSQRRDGTNIRILIKLTTSLARTDHNYVTFLNNIMRKCMNHMKLELVGRNYFDPAMKNSIPEYRIEIWPGFTTSIRQHEDRILMNVESTSKVVRQETAYDLLVDCKKSGSGDWKSYFEERILNATVITPYNNKSYNVDDIDFSATPMSTFDKKGTQVRYVDYFRERYQIQIRFKDQPLLISRPKEKLRVTTKNENVVLIPELCCLTGFTDKMRADFKLMSAVAKYTRIGPEARMEKIESFMKRLYSCTEAANELQSWNMSFNPTLVTFQGRVLPEELIRVGNGRALNLDLKKGEFPISRANLFDPNKLNKWAIIYPGRIHRSEIEAFLQTLHGSCSSFGFQISQPLHEPLPNDNSSGYVQAIEQLYNKGATLVMCIVMNQREERYSAIKKKCYVNRSIPCQVVLAKNVSKNNRSVCSKIGIQLSCKIGGSPWMVDVPPIGPTMLVGYDVFHDKAKKKSYGALVASINNTWSRYCSAVEAHDAGSELSDFVSVSLLKAFQLYLSHNNNVKPIKIIMYRDGVGEGNLRYCLEHEVKEIVKKLKEFYPNSEVPLTFVVVSKRINTRIFCSYGNPPPGTVADSEITLPTMYDFFLVSQAVNQGTVSPTNYNVIYDALKLKPDQIQRITYKLCMMYYNWSGTIRVPAPCQYAHKLAFLVGKSLHTEPNHGMDDLLYFL